MAWTYSDWITQTDDGARLTRLRLHIQEVSNKIRREVGAGDMSQSSRAVREYLDSLHKREEALASVVNADGTASGGVSRYVFD